MTELKLCCFKVNYKLELSNYSSKEDFQNKIWCSFLQPVVDFNQLEIFDLFDNGDDILTTFFYLFNRRKHALSSQHITNFEADWLVQSLEDIVHFVLESFFFVLELLLKSWRVTFLLIIDDWEFHLALLLSVFVCQHFFLDSCQCFFIVSVLNLDSYLQSVSIIVLATFLHDSSKIVKVRHRLLCYFHDEVD